MPAIVRARALNVEQAPRKAGHIFGQEKFRYQGSVLRESVNLRRLRQKALDEGSTGYRYPRSASTAARAPLRVRRCACAGERAPVSVRRRIAPEIVYKKNEVNYYSCIQISQRKHT